MALDVSSNQTYRLRELRDDALQGKRGELDRPTRTTRRFKEALTHPKAGEVVGEFPAAFDKGPRRPLLRRNPLKIAQARQQTRSAVAALMAREGISTFTRFGSRTPNKRMSIPGLGKSDDNEDEGNGSASANLGPATTRAAATAGPIPTTAAATSTSQPAWLRLASASAAANANAAPAAGSGAVQASVSSSDLDPDREAYLAKKQRDIQSMDQFIGGMRGYSMLENAMKQNDARVLKEAGKVDRALDQNGAKPDAKTAELSFSAKDAALNQQLNMRYLALQEKMAQPGDDLLSNLMEARDQMVKDSIDNVNG